MVNRFFEQVGGIIRVRLQGKNLEKVINMALARGIFINDVKRKEDGLHFKIRSSAYSALKSIAEENGYQLEITEKKGIPFYQALLKRRLGFVIGALIFIIALYFCHPSYGLSRSAVPRRWIPPVFWLPPLVMDYTRVPPSGISAAAKLKKGCCGT